MPGVAAASWRLILPGSIEQPERPHRQPASAERGSPPPIVDPARAAGAVIWAIDPRQRPAVGDVLLSAGTSLRPVSPTTS